MPSLILAPGSRSPVTVCSGAWQTVQRGSSAGLLIPRASAICFERAVVRVAKGLELWKSRRDQAWYWFWVTPPPPWQPELAQDPAPRILGVASRAKASNRNRRGRARSGRHLQNQRRSPLIDLRATGNLLKQRLYQCNPYLTPRAAAPAES